MELQDKIARYQEIERRGLLSQLPPEKQAIWAEIKSRGLAGEQPRETPAQPDPYSALDKAKYTLRAAGEGATFGLGDLVAGQMDVLASDLAGITHGQDWKERAKATRNLALHAFVPGASLTSDRFGKGRRAFVREQEAFAQEHPVMNFGGEMLGGLTTGIAGAGKKLATTAGQQGLKALAAEGAREGAKFGAAYGAGSGLTEDANKLSVMNALKGAGTGIVGGTAMGAVLPVTIAGATKGGNAIFGGGKSISKALRSFAGKGNQSVGNAGYVSTNANPENKVFLDLLASNPEGTMQAIKEGEPLISYANRKQLRRTRGAVTADDSADQAFIDYKKTFDEGKIAKGEDITARLISKDGGKRATERIAEEARAKYKPLYDEVMNTGEIELPREIITNETVFDAIKEAQKRPRYKNFKANDVRVLDKAKRILQDKYSKLERMGASDEAAEFQMAKEELVNFMDSKLPNYPKARLAYMEGKELEEFVGLGRELRTMKPTDIANQIKGLTAEQKEAVKAGLSDDILNSIYSTNNTGSDVLNKAFPLQLRRKMKMLGIDSEELVNEINKEIQANRNYQFIQGGSNTANKLADAESVGLLGKLVRGAKILTSPYKSARSAADYFDFKRQGLNGEEIVRLMFDPKALAKEAKRPEHQRKIAEILRKSKEANQALQAENPSGSVLKALGNKIKEEKGFVANPLGNGGKSPLVSHLTNEDKVVANITGKEIEGLGKDVRSSKPVVLEWFRKHIAPLKSKRADIGEISYPVSSAREVIGKTNDIEKIKLLPAVKNVVDNGKILNGGKLKATPERGDNIAGFYFIQGKINAGGKNKVLQVDIAQDNFGRKFYFYSEIKDDPGLGTLTITRPVPGSTNSITQKDQNVKGFLGKISDILRDKSGFVSDPLSDTQIAYHGTGVRGIKQFDTAFMGTGEGPQAHGWGSYFSGRKTAEGYRQRLSSGEKLYKGKPLENLRKQLEKEKQYEKAALIEDISLGVEDPWATEEIFNWYDKEIAPHITENKGQLYETKIPKNDVLLDEQKTFNKQPKKVQDALRKMAKDNIEIAKNYTLQEGIDENLTGGKIYNLLEMDLKNTWRNLGDKSGADPAEYVSKGLNEYGIKGITYDGIQDGRSFVIFNPMKDTKINRTFYSVLAALASAGLLNKKENK